MYKDHLGFSIFEYNVACGTGGFCLHFKKDSTYCTTSKCDVGFKFFLGGFFVLFVA